MIDFYPEGIAIIMSILLGVTLISITYWDNKMSQKYEYEQMKEKENEIKGGD